MPIFRYSTNFAEVDTYEINQNPLIVILNTCEKRSNFPKQTQNRQERKQTIKASWPLWYGNQVMTMTTDSVILAYGKHNVMLKLEKSQVFWARPKKHYAFKKKGVCRS